MKKFLLFFCVIFSLQTPASAQVDCGNIGFEKGTTLGWETSYGTMSELNQTTVFSSETGGTKGNLHMVTSLSSGNDPKVPVIPMVAPGSSHSLRLGNVVQGGDFSRIRTSYLITPDNTLFQYKFAIVLQNSPSSGRAVHEPFQKPGFAIEILDSDGAVLPCSNYGIQLQGMDAVDGFEAVGDIQYRNWTTGAIDLRNYVGKRITIVVTAHGCTRERHFGYAYFDAQCLKTEIRALSACPDADGLMTLIAPAGFGKYTWSNGATTQIVKVKANLGDQFFVKVEPLASLDESCAFQLDYTIKFQEAAAEIDSVICEGQQVAVGDTAYQTTGHFIRKVRMNGVCDSTVTLHLKVNPIVRHAQTFAVCEGDSIVVGDTTYRTTGIFIKKLLAFTGCDSIVTTNLTVVPLELSVAASDITMVQGDSVQIRALIDPDGPYAYRWEPSTGLSCVSCADPWARPDRSVKYTIFASDPLEACNKSAKVTLTVKPCAVYVPDAFSPNYDGNNDVLIVYGGHCIKMIKKLTIYNRWGEIIFQHENFVGGDRGAAWDGFYHGLMSNPGVYPYKVQAEWASGKLVDYNGVVNLIR